MARHFESVKTAAFNKLVGSLWVDTTEKIPFSILPLLQTIEEGKHKHYHARMKENKDKLNKLLDRWDIRSVGSLIDILPEKKPGVAGWIRRKQFVIDYNGRGELDLIRTDNIV
jgi:hypothetical protein